MPKLKKKEKLEQQKNSDIMDESVYSTLTSKTIKQLIAPSGINASNLDYLEVISETHRYARSFFVSSLPRIANFPSLFRNMYEFGDINTSVYIYPVNEDISQTKLNKTINELETERIVASDRGDINRESLLSQKK